MLVEVRDAGAAKGKGVFAAHEIPRGTRVLPIEGERYTLQQAEELEESGDVRANYMVFVQVGRKQFGVCLHGHTVGYVNHSRHQRNTKLVWDKHADGGHLVAVRDISAGEEILFDYGDRRRDVVADNLWLRQ